MSWGNGELKWTGDRCGSWSCWQLCVLVFVAGAGAAGACKLFLNCHLLGSQSALANEIVRYEGQRASLAGLPSNLEVTTVARGFQYPTDFEFFPATGS